MQALGIWPPKGDFLRVPQVEFHLGFPCFRCKRKRRKRRLYHCNVVDNRCPGPSLVWSNLRDAKHGMKIRCFAGSSRLDISLFSDAKRCSYGLFIALAMALEDQEIENHFGTEDSERIPELSNEVEDEDVQGLNPFHENGNFDDERGVDIRSAEELDEDKIMRVDVRGLAHSLQSAKSVEDIEEVLKDKDGLPLKVYSSMIRGFGREKKLEPAMALVEWLKKKGRESEGFHGPNLFIYNSLLGAVKHSERFEQVEGIMSDMVQNGITPDVVTCNTLMAIHLEQQQPAEALSVLHDVQNKGLSPSPASYSTALLAYRRMEDGSGALKLFVEVKEKYMKGDLGKCGDNDWKGEFVKLKNFTSRICYQVMRRWLVNDQNMSIDVLKLLIDMDKVELPPSQAELERLIWACTREEHYPVAKELYNRIRERHSEVSLSVCNHIIWLMGKSKKWWAALEIYEDLLDKGPRPNNLSYELIISHFNILLTAARRRGIWRWGVRLLNKMEGKGLRPGTREWNAVLVACSKASETTAAVQIFRRMVEKGEKPTIISYGALLSALEKGKLYDEAIRVWEHMIKVGIEPNLHAYTIMASIYVALGRLDVVDSIIREMVSTGNKPTVVTFNAIITGCARNGMESTAYEWFHRMKVLNISPNEITYEMLIEALAKDGKPKLAYDLYLRAHNEGLHLSRRAYDAVIQSSETFGATIDAALLGPRPVEKKNKVRIRKNLSEFCDLAGVPRRSIIFCPLNCLIMTTGNSAIILSLWPVHFFWTYNCVLRARQLGPILKLVLCPCIFVLLILWPVIGVVVSIVGGAAYGFLSPVFATFEAVGEGKTNELFHCIYDGTWSTVKGCFTIIRDFRDVCFHSYFSIMDDLQRQGSPDGKYYEIRVLYLPGAVVAGVLGISLDLPMILLIALFKSPYMLFRGWHRLFQDLIGREGPFLETICVPFAGLAILLWPLAVVGAVLGAVVSSIFLGAFAGVVAYQECSLWMGLCYVVAALAIFDEYSNDVLDMPEGTCFPRPYYRKDNPSQTQSGMLSSSSNSFQNPPSRSGSLKNFVVEMNALELLDRLFKECQFHGEKMVSEGLISLKDIEDAKSSKDSGGIVSIGLPAYCILQTLLQSAKANSVGILLSDNVTEITSTNRPKDTIFDWFLNPLLIIKDQIKAENLSEAEEEYLGQLVLLSGNPERLRSTYIGIPPESELKRAELDALARRLRGITKSISRYPTYRRRFECIMKTILEELGKKNGGSQSSNGHLSIQRSRSSFLHNLSQKSFNRKQSSSGSDKESNHVFERHMDIQ